MSLGGPVFDLAKLAHFNEQYVHKLSDDELADELIGWRLNRELLQAARAARAQADEEARRRDPVDRVLLLGRSRSHAGRGQFKVEGASNVDLKKAILAFVEAFEARDGWTKEMLEDVGAKWLEAQKWTLKQGYPLLRLATTGRKASPPLWETMVVLGKEITRRRLRRAADWIGARK